jgi:HprK-related kinase B
MQAMTDLALNPHDCIHQFFIAFGQEHYAVHSNHAALIDSLKRYFSPWLTAKPVNEGLPRIYLFSQESVKTQFNWQDWPREEGKTGLKEQIYDTEKGRWVHKFKTGMVFFQHRYQPFAVGPCEQHVSQVINFIINQHINHLQQQGGLICHASCLSLKNSKSETPTGIAVAALSGGGKSTTLLRLMDEPDAKFISNDRLFLFQHDDIVTAHGVAKQPRVNPGTLYNNDRLRFILSEQKQRQVAQMSPQALWRLEDKHDVMIENVYGKHAMASSTPLHHVVLLNWSHSSPNKDVSFRAVNVLDKPELMAAIAKSPGPFYQNSSGEFLQSACQPAYSQYSEMLASLKVWEVSGAVNFTQITALLRSALDL